MNAQMNPNGNDIDSDLDSLYDPFGEEVDCPDDQDVSDSASSADSDTSDTAGSVDPQARLLEDLESDLNSLTLEAETILSRQPRSTQLILARETKGLFKGYEKYGSMARLRVGIEKFLRLGDERGRLRIEDDKNDENDTRSLTLQPTRPKRRAHYGEAFMLNFTSDDDAPKFNAETDFITPPIKDPFNPNPNSYIHHPLRIVDPDSIPYVTTLPWDPIATKMTWPAHLAWPRGFLSAINKILSIVDQESRVRLFHHVTKWGPSPVFRAGIAEHVKAQYSTIFETAEENSLGLTPETRSFLRDIYFKKQYLNTAERRMLALSCRINEESVKLFWEDTAMQLKGYGAMRTFMAAREIEKHREARKKFEGEARLKEQKRREEVRKEHERRILELQAGRADPYALLYYQVDGDANMQHAGRDKAKDGSLDVRTSKEENTMGASMSR
ncbi:hypothetical protein G647_02811 [Cladophialophora carrionii CBS 160.54]|uniref:Uncharacterized protein n=1 Tax=Cladophialophora carrionii CBS 160.54 TaxID=1279043 RepID=V9DGM0_9EURO|nr:uncharacterized protein G647_02811 [Cladophialophora carrionii CBS 160.54]ETI26034.1 hypothetical protein G647_02811 [Cladophialophora carrionii CBS 160.54]